MAKSVLANIYTDLVTMMKNVIESKYLFLKNRPKISDGSAPMSKFAVIDLPIAIEDITKGKKKRMLTTTGVFYLFTQARSNSTLDVNATGDFTDDVIDLFPYKGNCCSVSDPVVRMEGNDENGFQVVIISFDLQTKWEVFK